MPRPPHTPAYCLHKHTGQAVVRLNGVDHYLGPHDTPESRAEYDRLIAEWLANGRQLPRRGHSAADLTVAELVASYCEWASAYYRKHGEETKEAINIRIAMRPLRKLYGHTAVRDFGPLALKTVRQAYIDAGLCRNECNKRTRHIIRAFKWGVAEEMVPPSVHHGLKAVPGLRWGRSSARETEPVHPVPEASIEAVKPFVPRQVWAMSQLQLLSGARPGEVCTIRRCDLDMTGDVWTYVPESHKTQHHGHSRTIFIGPKAQEVLRPWLRPELDAYLFSPREAIVEHRAELRARRKTPVQPCQAARQPVPRPEKAPGDHYTADSYWRAYQFRAVRIEHFPLGTPYPTIVNAIGTLVREPILQPDPVLAIDATGLGGPIVDMFVKADLPARLYAITITGLGEIQRHGLGYPGVVGYKVPKQELVDAVQFGLQSGRLKIDRRLPHYDLLMGELQNFEERITESEKLKRAHESYGARSGYHDDILMALSYGVWLGMRREVAYDPGRGRAPGTVPDADYAAFAKEQRLELESMKQAEEEAQERLEREHHSISNPFWWS
jgi:integrase